MICSYPSSKALTVEEKDLLWRYRYYLVREKKSLTKLLKSVVWEDANESQHISDIMKSWPSIEVEDALELLSESFQGNSIVRDFAVQQLQTADDKYIKMYLLQLIQALRFDFISGGSQESTRRSSLCLLLIQKSLKNVELCVLFYWYLNVEEGLVFQSALASLMAALEGNPMSDMLARQTHLVTTLAHISKEIKNMKASRAKKVHDPFYYNHISFSLSICLHPSSSLSSSSYVCSKSDSWYYCPRLIKARSLPSSCPWTQVF